MRLNKLSELNDICNFQETIILCEIFENRAKEMMQKFPYNLRKCISVSSLSGCIHQYLSKAIIALRTQAEIVKLFEETLIGGFSCVNTRLAFDSIILLSHNSQGQYKQNFKAIYRIKNEEKNIFAVKRVVTNMAINNQYDNAMTKPLPTGSIKRRKKTSNNERISSDSVGNF